jgi:glycosyltransferase involved in cell wall biosynthesis
MFSSTIIPTINRSTLTRAVQSVLEQDFTADDFEVLVVNDSGTPLPELPWMESERVRVINTNRRERSVARNTGAAMARGKYLNFLDDDDILLPGALTAFWQLDQQGTGSLWLHGSYQTVDNDGRVIENIFPEHEGNNFALLVSSEGIPLQISMVEAKHFHRVGAFDPKITGVEDRDLGRRLAMAGTISYTPTPVAHIRIGQVGSTTNWGIIAEGDRQSREKAMSLHGSLSRALASARTCRWHGQIIASYWRGRLCRAYLASMIWNLKRGNVLIAINRGASFLFSLGFHWLTGNFWLGMQNLDIVTGVQVLQGSRPASSAGAGIRRGSVEKGG